MPSGPPLTRRGSPLTNLLRAMNMSTNSYSCSSPGGSVTRATAEEVSERSDQRSNESPRNLPSVPQQGRSREKLDRLLVAGAQLFGERGFDGTRISDVAELGGCSVGVFYQRF